jgi:hypothetical protein
MMVVVRDGGVSAAGAVVTPFGVFAAVDVVLAAAALAEAGLASAAGLSVSLPAFSLNLLLIRSSSEPFE